MCVFLSVSERVHSITLGSYQNKGLVCLSAETSEQAFESQGWKIKVLLYSMYITKSLVESIFIADNYIRQIIKRTYILLSPCKKKSRFFCYWSLWLCILRRRAPCCRWRLFINYWSLPVKHELKLYQGQKSTGWHFFFLSFEHSSYCSPVK